MTPAEARARLESRRDALRAELRRLPVLSSGVELDLATIARRGFVLRELGRVERALRRTEDASAPDPRWRGREVFAP